MLSGRCCVCILSCSLAYPSFLVESVCTLCRRRLRAEPYHLPKLRVALSAAAGATAFLRMPAILGQVLEAISHVCRICRASSIMSATRRTDSASPTAHRPPPDDVAPSDDSADAPAPASTLPLVPAMAVAAPLKLQHPWPCQLACWPLISPIHSPATSCSEEDEALTRHQATL
jgi:hypothetical protein